ncbi:MAG: VWA domain-containing protein, partial [Pirellulales bacterium]|nr:VWA domain-containing protein [Pirellulales bacterium]
MQPLKSRREGQILILFTLFIGFLLGFCALAFDMAYALVMRAQLVTALDAATMAAIRFVPQGNVAMDAAARRTFAANLPSGKLLALNPTLSAPTVTTDTGAIRVRYTASVDTPMFFARWFGHDKLTVNATTTAARRDRNIMLVLDYSWSVRNDLADIKNAAKEFVSSFSETADQVGLVVFSTSARIEYPPQKAFKADMNAAIEGVREEYMTNKAAGLYYAYRALLELNDPLKGSKMNEIVFFTDGEANWFPGQFNVSVGGGS